MWVPSAPLLLALAMVPFCTQLSRMASWNVVFVVEQLLRVPQLGVAQWDSECRMAEVHFKVHL